MKKIIYLCRVRVIYKRKHNRCKPEIYMRKINPAGRGLGVAIMCLACGLLLVMNSCIRKETMDVSDLVKTVPSSASMVAAVNLHSLIEKTGGKIKGSEIEPGKELKSFAASGKLSEIKEVLGSLKGIDPEGLIYFKDAYDNYVTFLLSDTHAFMESISSESGSSFEENDGVSVCGNVAINGAQAWINMSSNNVDVRAIKNYSSLNESQSFFSNPMGSKFVETTDDVVLWSLLKELGTSGYSVPVLGDLTSAKMFSGMVFENPDASLFTLNFEKGKMVAEMSVLNSKGEQAKYLLPADKIDVDQLKTLASGADVVVGVSVPKSLVKKVNKMASSFGGNFMGLSEDALGAIDGTIGVAMTMDVANTSSPVSGFVTTDGKGSVDLMNFLSTFGPTKKDGKLIRFSKGEVTGELDVAQAVESLKGATLGVVVGFPDEKKAPNQLMPWLRSFSLALVPEKGSLVGKVIVNARDDSENILLTILKSSN